MILYYMDFVAAPPVLGNPLFPGNSLYSPLTVGNPRPESDLILPARRDDNVGRRVTSSVPYL